MEEASARIGGLKRPISSDSEPPHTEIVNLLVDLPIDLFVVGQLLDLRYLPKHNLTRLAENLVNAPINLMGLCWRGGSCLCCHIHRFRDRLALAGG